MQQNTEFSQNMSFIKIQNIAQHKNSEERNLQQIKRFCDVAVKKFTE